MPPRSTLTRDQLIDAAVAIVEENAAEALASGPKDWGSEYIEAYKVANMLTEAGVISHEHTSSSIASWRDEARRSLEGKVKRLLDAEAAKPNARILRCSSHRHGLLPRLNGTMRGLYGNAVGYTTPELYRRAEEAVSAAVAQRHADAETMKVLLERATAVGMPEPVSSTSHAVTYSADSLRALVKRLETDPDD